MINHFFSFKLVVSLSFQLNCNKPYTISVPRIVEITYTISICDKQGLPKLRLCKEYIGREESNALGVNLRRNFAFGLTRSLLLLQRNNLT